jgi:hypothetical protein
LTRWLLRSLGRRRRMGGECGWRPIRPRGRWFAR